MYDENDLPTDEWVELEEEEIRDEFVEMAERDQDDGWPYPD